MNEILDVNEILDDIRHYLKVNSDAELANFLGVKPSTVSSWRKRNSLDFELIYAKCNNIDANWLLTGKGEMLKEKIDPRAKEKIEWFNDRMLEKDYLIRGMKSRIEELESELAKYKK